MSILLQLKNLNLAYPHKTIFKEASLTLKQRDRIGLLGLNGHGKSSLFKIITQEIFPDHSTPAFIYDRSQELTILHIPQELPSLDSWNVQSYFYAFYPQFHKLHQQLEHISQRLCHPSLTEQEMNTLIEQQDHLLQQAHAQKLDQVESQYLNYLKYFQISQLERSMHLLSGGEQRKVALAIGLSALHELILWDEPTNHLDMDTIELFEEELQQSKKSFMVISHDRVFLQNTVDRIVHIREGVLQTFQGSYQEYLDYLQQEEQKREQDIHRLGQYHKRETAWIRRGVKARRTKSKKRIEDYQTLNQQIAELKSKAHRKVQLSLESSVRKSKTLIQGEDLSFQYPQHPTLFEHLNFTISKGDKIALLGKNGVGKSTLLQLIMNQSSPTSGSLKSLDQISIGYFSQKREALDDNQTPWSLIGEGMDFIISENGQKRHVASYLEQFLFKSEEIKRPISTFSGGEKNRLQLALFMKHPQDLWIFDEPTNDLDLETIGILEEELKQYTGAVIIVGHDRAFIENVSEKCWVLHNKTLEFFEGGFEQASAYLESLALEDILNKDHSAKNAHTSSSKKSLKKDEKKLEDLSKNIEVLEKKANDLKKELADFHYNHLDHQQTKKLKDLQKSLEQTEKKIEQLFEEWSQLDQ